MKKENIIDYKESDAVMKKTSKIPVPKFTSKTKNVNSGQLLTPPGISIGIYQKELYSPI